MTGDINFGVPVELSDVDRSFIDVVTAFCREKVGPRAAEIDDRSAFFPDLLEQAAELGLQGLLFDEHGGVDLTHHHLADLANQLVASYSGAVALGISIARLHAYLLSSYAAPEIGAEWVPELLAGRRFGSFVITEPDVGSDIRGITTVATSTADGYRLSGQKAWITQAPAASFGIVLAKVDSTARDAETGAFFVPYTEAGVTVGSDEPMLGFRGMPMSTVSFAEVELPAGYRLAVDGFRGMLEGVNMARLDAAGYACGFMQASLRHCIDYLPGRAAFGATLADLPTIHQRLGEMSTDLAAARALLSSAGASFASGGGGDNTLISQAKVFATDAAMRHTTMAVQLHGGAGVHLGLDPQRLMRDAKITQIIDGASDVHYGMVGRRVFRSTW